MRGTRRNSGRFEHGSHHDEGMCLWIAIFRLMGVGKSAAIAEPVTRRAARCPKEREQETGMVGTLKIDQQVIAAGANFSDPCQGIGPALTFLANIDGEDFGEAWICFEQTYTIGLCVQIDFSVRKGARNIFHQRAGDHHITQGAPFDDEYAPDLVLGDEGAGDACRTLPSMRRGSLRGGRNGARKGIK